LAGDIGTMVATGAAPGYAHPGNRLSARQVPFKKNKALTMEGFFTDGELKAGTVAVHKTGHGAGVRSAHSIPLKNPAAR
jgi:hypothetical protein